MEVSVIIPTYQGKHKLPIILNALYHQSFKDFQLVVVVDGSTDGTQEWLDEQDLPFLNLRILTQKNKGRAGARNSGANIASGNLLIFYDDDMEPVKDSVERHVMLHQQYDELIIGGNQIENIHPSKTDIQNYKASLSYKWLKGFKKGVNHLDRKRIFLTAANMSIKRDLFVKLGGFDERLSDAEDYHLALKTIERGIPIYFDTLNKAIHHDAITCVGYIKRIRQYTEAHKRLRELFSYVPPLPPKRVNFIRLTIYWFFSNKFWAHLIDTKYMTFLLPKMIRYRLYDVVIHALGVENRNVQL